MQREHLGYGAYAARRREARRHISTLLASAKAGQSCACGESHPACLDFHHRDPRQKAANTNQMRTECWSVAEVLAEIGKCDLVCSNCHRKLHHEQRHAA